MESAIAASVVLAAVNNFVPFFAERGWMVAFGFGLLHGFGFANALRDLGLRTGQLAATLFGFNLGVELGQLAIVAVFLPLGVVSAPAVFLSSTLCCGSVRRRSCWWLPPGWPSGCSISNGCRFKPWGSKGGRAWGIFWWKNYFLAASSMMPENESSQDRPPLRDSPLREQLANFSLLDALRQRRSRRFGLGMKIPAGPLAYASKHRSRPLTEDEEAALVFAACGITGHALADLCYAKGEGGGIMAGLVARTIASGDGLQTVALIVINDGGAWLVRRPRELPAGDIAKLIELGQRGEFTELYRRCRVKIAQGTAQDTPTEPLFNINANRWSAHAPGSTIFLPVNDLTFMYVNGLLEILNPETGAFILDERNHFLPAGLGKFARSRGGHLEDDPHQGRVATVRQVEQFVTEFVTVEQGMMLQNLGLMAQALGLGGYPNFANHEFAWFQSLGFRMLQMPASRYVGAGWLASLAMKLLKRNPLIPYPVGSDAMAKCC